MPGDYGCGVRGRSLELDPRYFDLGPLEMGQSFTYLGKCTKTSGDEHWTDSPDVDLGF